MANDWWIRVVRGCDMTTCAECGEWIYISEAATMHGEPVCSHHLISYDLTWLWAERARHNNVFLRSSHDETP